MLTYNQATDYLLALGQRFRPIGRSVLSLDGLVPATLYPVLVVEGDAAGQDVYRDNAPSGAETFTFAVQVLTRPEREDVALVPGLLVLTKGWADALAEQVRREHLGCLLSVSKQPLPGTADSALSTGWRLELGLQLRNPLDRDASAALFTSLA